MRALVVIVLLGTLGCEARLSLGAGCTRSSDCEAPLVCSFQRCRAECVEQRDCPLGAMCLLDTEDCGSACVYRGSGSGLPMAPSRTLTSPSTSRASFGCCVGG